MARALGERSPFMPDLVIMGLPNAEVQSWDSIGMVIRIRLGLDRL